MEPLKDKSIGNRTKLDSSLIQEYPDLAGADLDLSMMDREELIRYIETNTGRDPSEIRGFLDKNHSEKNSNKD